MKKVIEAQFQIIEKCGTPHPVKTMEFEANGTDFISEKVKSWISKNSYSMGLEKGWSFRMIGVPKVIAYTH